MAWRYTFDGGAEKPLEASSLYQVAAMAAFTREPLFNIPQLEPGGGVKRYSGHVLKLWDDKLADQYPPNLYGLAWDEYGCLKICILTITATR